MTVETLEKAKELQATIKKADEVIDKLNAMGDEKEQVELKCCNRNLSIYLPPERKHLFIYGVLMPEIQKEKAELIRQLEEL